MQDLTGWGRLWWPWQPLPSAFSTLSLTSHVLFGGLCSSHDGMTDFCCGEESDLLGQTVAALTTIAICFQHVADETLHCEEIFCCAETFYCDVGSDLLGQTVAALAAIAICFEQVDADYANTLEAHARDLYV